MVVTVEPDKIAYMPLPKAACSSVKTTLAWIDGAMELNNSDRETAHTIYQTRRFRLDRWEAYGKDWFKFCIIRDPFARLMSCYQDLVVTRGILSHSRRVRAMDGALPVQPDPDFFFQNLDAYRRASSAIKHHSFHVEMFLGADLGVYDVVYPTADLLKLERALNERCRTSLRLPKANATKTKLTLDDLAPKTQESIAKWLAPDYALLAGHYTSPFLGYCDKPIFQDKVA